MNNKFDKEMDLMTPKNKIKDNSQQTKEVKPVKSTLGLIGESITDKLGVERASSSPSVKSGTHKSADTTQDILKKIGWNGYPELLAITPNEKRFSYIQLEKAISLTRADTIKKVEEILSVWENLSRDELGNKMHELATAEYGEDNYDIHTDSRNLVGVDLILKAIKKELSAVGKK